MTSRSRSPNASTGTITDASTAIGHIPPVEAENNFYTNLSAITMTERAPLSR